LDAKHENYKQKNEPRADRTPLAQIWVKMQIIQLIEQARNELKCLL